MLWEKAIAMVRDTYQPSAWDGWDLDAQIERVALEEAIALAATDGEHGVSKPRTWVWLCPTP